MREIAPFGLRMTPKLKDRLEEIAKAGGRSLQKEIVMRLESSLIDAKPDVRMVAEPDAKPYIQHITEVEAEMLRTFRRWTVEKQLGFLTLFK